MVITNSIYIILFGILGLFIIIELGLVGYVVSEFDDASNSFVRVDVPSEWSFMLFNAIWSLLVLGYLVGATLFFSHAYDVIVQLVLLSITSIFWFAGAIAVADWVGDWVGTGDCGGDTFCGTVKASVAFGFFNWIIFTAITVLKFLTSRGAIADGPAKSSGTTTTHTHTGV